MTPRELPIVFGLVAVLAGPAAAAPDLEGGVYVPFDEQVLASATGAEVVLNGNVVFSAPDVDLQAGFVGADLVDLSAAMVLRGAVTAELTAGVSGDFSDEIFPPLVALPPIALGVDVEVLPSVYTRILVEGKAEAGMKLALVQRFACPLRFDLGPGLLDAALDAPPRVHTRLAEPVVNGVRVDVTLTVETGVLFLVTVQGVPLAGPYFDVESGLDLAVDPLGAPWWDLDGGLVVHAGWYDGSTVLFQERLWSDAFDTADAGGGIPVALPPTRWSRALDLGTNEEAWSLTPFLDGFALVSPQSGAGGSGWFARLEADGAIAWEQGAQVVAGGSTRPKEVHATPDGGLVVGGNAGLASAPRVERLAADGTPVWARSYTDALGGVLALESLAARDDGGAVFCGRALHAPLNLPLVVFVAADGLVERAFELDLGGAVSFASFVQVVPAADGGWILAGWADYDDSATEIPPTIDSRNALVCKVAANDTVVFARVVGGPGYDQAFAVAEAEDGAICAAGELKSGNDHTPWLFCLEPDGATRWSATYAGAVESGNDGLRGLAAVPGGGFVASGFTGLGAARDAFLFQVDERGMPVWWKAVLGPHHDEPLELRWLDDGVVLCGLTKSLDAGSANPASDMWLTRADVDGMLHFDAATGFDASNPAVTWETYSTPTVALAGTLAPLTVSSSAATLSLVPTAATATVLTE